MKAHIIEVTNKDAKTSSNASYQQVTLEDGTRFLFTESQLKTAKKRAMNNTEDLWPAEVFFPTEKPSIFKKLFW
jgi:hypothetical protein